MARNLAAPRPAVTGPGAERGRRPRVPASGQRLRLPHPTLSIESAQAYARRCRPREETEPLIFLADVCRDRPRVLRLGAEKRQRIAALARPLLEALCEFQGTEEGRHYPALPDGLGFLLRLTEMEIDSPGGRSAPVAQLLKSDRSDRLLDFAHSALSLAREYGWKRQTAAGPIATPPTPTELMAIAVARGLQDPTPDRAGRLDQWRKRVATARRLLRHPAAGPTWEELKGHSSRLYRELAARYPGLRATWKGHPFFR